MTPADRFAALPGLLAADTDLLRRGRWVTVECRIDVGSEPFFLSIRDGALAGFDRGPRLMRSTDFHRPRHRRGLDELLAADPGPRLARPLRADQARRGVDGRRLAAAAAESAVLQGSLSFTARIVVRDLR